MLGLCYVLKDGKHYIECKKDYSDLEKKIEWCYNNRKKCIEIGRSAQNLFETSCTPKRIVSWIEEIIKNKGECNDT